MGVALQLIPIPIPTPTPTPTRLRQGYGGLPLPLQGRGSFLRQWGRNAGGAKPCWCRAGDSYSLRRDYQSEERPSRTAYLVRPATLFRLSFFMMLRRCVSTVLTEMLRVKAMSLVFLPSAV